MASQSAEQLAGLSKKAEAERRIPKARAKRGGREVEELRARLEERAEELTLQIARALEQSSSDKSVPRRDRRMANMALRILNDSASPAWSRIIMLEVLLRDPREPDDDLAGLLRMGGAGGALPAPDDTPWAPPRHKRKG